MKQMTFEHNVDMILKGPNPDLFENLIHVSPTDLNPAIFALLLQPRRNQKELSKDEKDNFNFAIKSAIDDGLYGPLAAVHADMTHLMHSHEGPIGTLRFLPWHRVYLYKLELLLQNYVPGIRIPYWMWERDHDLLSWVYLPSGVTRGPDTTFTLPKDADVDKNYAKTTYLEFTQGLEDMHNTVHQWVGGTMNSLMYSPQDPMFWLHHANVDRIWSTWNSILREEDLDPYPLPVLSSPYDKLDPWLDTVNDTKRTSHYNYYYKTH
jgi:tyrosinase